MRAFVILGLALALVVACRQETSEPLLRATEESVLFPEPPQGSIRSETSDPLLLRHVDIVDGTGAEPIRNQDVLIEAGKIAKIAPDIEADGVTALDLEGQTLLPGLVNCHTHLESVPGAALRGDDPELVEKQRHLQLRAHLASGVTTVLDTAISKPTLLRLQAHLKAGHPGPTIFSLSPFLTPHEGYLATEGMRTHIFGDLWPPIEDPAMIGEQLREAAPLDPVGVKVTVEEGMVFPIWPLFSSEELAVIKREAAAVDTKVFVHSMTNEAHRIALQLDPYAFVHVGMGDERLEEDVLDEIKESGAYMTSTLAVYQMERWFWNGDSMERAWIEARVPKVQWETAHHPQMKQKSLDLMTPEVKPGWLPTWLARAFAPLIRRPDAAVEELASSQRALLSMYRAGIPIVMGADEGNWPLFVTFFHGVGALLEMELLEQAGIPRRDIIVAATSRAAQMLGQEHRIGAVRVGLDADLIVVPKNPLEDGMRALHDMTWVIKRGLAKTPQAWLHQQ